MPIFFYISTHLIVYNKFNCCTKKKISNVGTSTIDLQLKKLRFEMFKKPVQHDLVSKQQRQDLKGMATHSSILAWKIPWSKPGRLQSMG